MTKAPKEEAKSKKGWPPRVLRFYYEGTAIPNPTPEEKAWMLLLGKYPDVFKLEELGLWGPELPDLSDPGRIDLRDHQGPPAPLVLGFVSPEGTTVLYGEGGNGKGWIAAKWASQLGKVAILDFENHPSEWSYRLAKFGTQLEDVLYFSPDVTMERWAERGGSAAIEDAAYLIVDSAAYTSNVDDPYSPSGAMSYKRARRLLGNLPTILLAHTPKGGDSIYGSVFFKNESRLAWLLKQESLARKRVLECKKSNAYPTLEGARFVIEFSEADATLNLHPQGTAWTVAPSEAAAFAAPMLPEPEPPVLEW